MGVSFRTWGAFILYLNRISDQREAEAAGAVPNANPFKHMFVSIIRQRTMESLIAFPFHKLLPITLKKKKTPAEPISGTQVPALNP